MSSSLPPIRLLRLLITTTHAFLFGLASSSTTFPRAGSAANSAMTVLGSVPVRSRLVSAWTMPLATTTTTTTFRQSSSDSVRSARTARRPDASSRPRRLPQTYRVPRQEREQQQQRRDRRSRLALLYRGGDISSPSSSLSSSSRLSGGALCVTETTTRKRRSRSPTTMFRASIASESERQMSDPSSRSDDEGGGGGGGDDFAGIGVDLPVKYFGGIPYWDTSFRRAPSDGGGGGGSSKKFRVLFVLGGPGAGKGTQCALMEENYPMVHLSVGELLRNEQTNVDSPHRDLIEQTLVAGKIVPVQISLQLVQKAMRDKSAEMGDQILFLVDGFPRNMDNLSGWYEYMRDSASIWSVLVYQCPLPVLEERIMERSKESGRSDDNLTSLKKRFHTFESDTMPIINMLRETADALDTAAAVGAESSSYSPSSSSSSSEPPSWSVVDVRGDRPLDDVWSTSRRELDRLITHDVLTSNAALLEAVGTGDATAYGRLCDPEGLAVASAAAADDDDETLDAIEIMRRREGDGGGGPVGDVKNAVVDVVSGKRVVVEYDRIVRDTSVRERRVWVHQGKLGWRNVDYSRTPL